ncbi:MAG: glycosyltransferase [Chloroflexi bacterium]|nr:glycosyltransferase [Chloroflexota bacterium]
MSGRPRASIVMPSLNQGRFIAQSIESVLAQDEPSVELIVVDGGSSDETLAILKSYGARLQWISEKDDGQSQAVNKGWRMARGEIWGWLNADDLLAPDATRRAVDALESDATLAGVYGDCAYIDEAGAALGKYPAEEFDYEKLVLRAEDFIPQPGVFLRREWIERVGVLDENLHYVMDYDLWLRLGMRAPLKYLRGEMARARLHRGAKTLASAPRFGDELASVFSRLAGRQDFPPKLAEQKNIILANAFVHAASYCFWGGETRRARFYLGRAWRETPFLKSRSFYRLALFSLAGKLGWRLAERLRGNPFRLETGWLR